MDTPRHSHKSLARLAQSHKSLPQIVGQSGPQPQSLAALTQSHKWLAKLAQSHKCLARLNAFVAIRLRPAVYGQSAVHDLVVFIRSVTTLLYSVSATRS